MEANLGSKSIELIPQYQYIQDGNPGNNPIILTDRGMGDIAGLQRCVFPHSNTTTVTKVSEVFPVQSDLPIHTSSLWSGHSSRRVYKGGQRSEANGTSKGYPDPPVRRRLVTESPVPGNLPTTYPDPLGPEPAVRVGSKHEKVRINPSAGLQFRRLPIQPVDRLGSTHSGPVGNPAGKVEIHQTPGKVAQSGNSCL